MILFTEHLMKFAVPAPPGYSSVGGFYTLVNSLHIKDRIPSTHSCHNQADFVYCLQKLLIVQHLHLYVSSRNSFGIPYCISDNEKSVQRSVDFHCRFLHTSHVIWNTGVLTCSLNTCPLRVHIYLHWIYNITRIIEWTRRWWCKVLEQNTLVYWVIHTYLILHVTKDPMNVMKMMKTSPTSLMNHTWALLDINLRKL